MQEQIAKGMHGFSHSLFQTDSSHHEDEHVHGHHHSHEHKMITFFSKIFSSESEGESEHDGVFFNYTLDKHFAQEYPSIDFKFHTITKHKFFYSFHIPKSVKSIPNPPPEIFFSQPFV